MAKLNAADRKKLPAKVFGLPSERKYPLDTKNRARDALSRASANATSSQQEKIREKVHRLYPDLKLNPAKLHSLASMAA